MNSLTTIFIQRAVQRLTETIPTEGDGTTIASAQNAEGGQIVVKTPTPDGGAVLTTLAFSNHDAVAALEGWVDNPIPGMAASHLHRVVCAYASAAGL